MHVRTPVHPGRPGSVLSTELLLVMPIVLALLLAGVQFAATIAVEARLAHASSQGARVAATNGSHKDVVQAVEKVLGNDLKSHAEICSVLKDTLGNPLPSGAPVQVTVKVPAACAVPDLLRFIGYSIRGKILLGSTVMCKE